MTEKKILLWVPPGRINGKGHFNRIYPIYEEIDSSYYFFNQIPEFEVPDRSIVFDSKDGEEILNFFEKIGVFSIVIDNFFLDDELLRKISQSERRVLYYWTNKTELCFDGVFNTNPYADALLINKAEYSKEKFFGIEYHSIRSEIKNINKEKVKNKVFVCLGNTEAEHLHMKLADLYSKELSYEFVLGSGVSQEYKEELNRFLIERELKFTLYQNPMNFFEIMQSCSFAIVSASTIIYECFYTQLPFVAVEYVENQRDLANYLRKIGVKVFKKNDDFSSSNLLDLYKYSDQVFSRLDIINRMSSKFSQLIKFIKGEKSD